MRDIRIAAAQFEAHDGDKDYNFDRVGTLAAQAAGLGAEMASFHECCLTGYTACTILPAGSLVVERISIRSVKSGINSALRRDKPARGHYSSSPTPLGPSHSKISRCQQ